MKNTLEALGVVRILLIVIAIVFAIALVVVLIMLLRARQKRKKELAAFTKHLHKEMRSDVLDRAIVGTRITSSSMLTYWLVKVVEQNRFGETEHFFNLSEGDVTIGKDFPSNKLCIYDELFDRNQCKVTLLKERPALINLSGSVATEFVPGKQYGRNIKKGYKMRDGETIKLFTLDTIAVGETKLVFYVFNSTSGLV